MEAFIEERWFIIFAVIWAIHFWLFGMQRASLLISRNAGVEWRGVGEQLLPTWYKITWLVIICYWGFLLSLVIYVDWRYALGLAVGGFVLNSVLPIPYVIYKGFFRERIRQLRRLHQNEIAQVLEEALVKAPF